MRVGDEWAYRAAPRKLGGPLGRVEVVDAGGSAPPDRVRVRFLDGSRAGELDWVGRRTLLAPWREVAHLVRDERRESAVAAASRAVRGSVDFEAVSLVLGVARPRNRLKLRGRIADAGVLEIRDLDLVASWLTLSAHQLRREPLVFEDRRGRCLAPWPVTLLVARAVVREFTEQVLAEVTRREQGLAHEHPVPTWRRAREQERRAFREAVLARVREWCELRRY